MFSAARLGLARLFEHNLPSLALHWYPNKFLAAAEGPAADAERCEQHCLKLRLQAVAHADAAFAACGASYVYR